MPDDTSMIDAWNVIRGELSRDERITAPMYGFVSLVEPKGIMAGTFYLEVPNEFTRGMLEHRVRVPLLSAIGALDDSFGVSTFAFVVNPDIEHEPMSSPSSESLNPFEPVTGSSATVAPPVRVVEELRTVPATDTRLNPKYSFDNFVIGGSNRFAHAAAVAVAEAPARRTTRSSSTATRASARPTSCTPSATTR